MSFSEVTIIMDEDSAINIHYGDEEPFAIYGNFFTSEVPFGISRIKDKVQGLIVNTSPYTLRVTYSSLKIEQFGEEFGPVLDYILPMQAKELGAAPNSVLWNIEIAPKY